MEPILVEARGDLRVVTLNRPERRNALSLSLLENLAALLDDLAGDAGRCLVITGAGRAFCAGADVKEWAEAAARGESEGQRWSEAAHRLIRKLAGFAWPTVAALNGSAVGAGLDLALACDFRLAAASARFRPGYTTMGYSPDAGGTWFLPRLIGIERAKRFLFLDETLTAAEALGCGLVTEVCPDDALRGEAERFAGRLAAGPTLAFGETKALLEGTFGRTLEQQLVREQQAAARCGASADAREAIQAAAAKRAPNYKGL